MPGILYVSKEFGTAAHLCACGCESKVRTPLGPTAWSMKQTKHGPTLWPSVGNWQKPCKSHYLIIRGDVIWAEKWTEADVTAGRCAEAARRVACYDIEYGDPGVLKSFRRWLKKLFQ
ncbi:MAG: DUF6527 family protein [Planctomycetota bacterium]